MAVPGQRRPARPRLPPRGRQGGGRAACPVRLGRPLGADIVKALALGATAVGIGRPYAYGLALGGAKGVAHVLRCLLAETDLIMAVDGYPSRADLTPETLRPVS